MSSKEELHNLVDQLDDERTTEALVYLRRLLHEDEASEVTAMAKLTQRMRARAMGGHAFFAQRPIDLQTLATRQDVQPVTNFDDLLGDFWPEDETADDFFATVRQWRREGGHA